MNLLHFADPGSLWLLLFLPLLVILKVMAQARSQALLARAVAVRLMPALVTPGAAWRGWTALGCELLALALMIVALARPQLGFTEEEVLTSGRSILIAIDTSRSMLANDLMPDRLTRTKLVVTDLIAKLPTDRIGLIAFAGSSYLQAPVTQDHDALLEILDQCDTNIIPRGGSNLAGAIDMAVETFKAKNLPEGKTLADLTDAERVLLDKAQSTSQALLIFSDGEELEGQALAAAKAAAEANVTIITIGVGTKQGGIMANPESKGRDYIRDEQGKIVKSVLQQEVLEEVARATRGLYLPLTEVLSDNRLNLILSKLDSGSNKNKTLRKPVERYPWPLSGSLFFLLASVAVRILRRSRVSLASLSASPALSTLALLLLAITPAGAKTSPAAKEPAPLHDPAPYEKRLEDLTDTSAGGLNFLAWKRLGEGSVAYAKGDYDAALEKFGKALLGHDPDLLTQAHFDLGNTFFQRGKLSMAEVKTPDKQQITALITQLQASVAQYDETLKLAPKHAEAAQNKQVIEDFLKALQQQQAQKEQQKGKKDKKDQKDKDQDQQEKKEGDQQAGDQPQEGEPKDGEPKDGQEGDPKEGDGQKSGTGKEGQEGEPKDGKSGKSEDQEGKDGDAKSSEDKRTDAQKAQDKAAQEASNREFKKSDEKPGEKPTESLAEAQKKADQKKDAKTGFSRVEARRNLDRMADTVEVRPQIEDARPDRVFKNW